MNTLVTTLIYREDENRHDDTLGCYYPNCDLEHSAPVRFDMTHLLLNHRQRDDTLFGTPYQMTHDDDSWNSHFVLETDCNVFPRDRRLRHHLRHRTATADDSSDSVQNDDSYADRSNSNFLHLNSKKIFCHFVGTKPTIKPGRRYIPGESFVCLLFQTILIHAPNTCKIFELAIIWIFCSIIQYLDNLSNVESSGTCHRSRVNHHVMIILKPRDGETLPVWVVSGTQ